MKTIITVTFHRAHNHGSALQAYALQEFVKKLGRESGIDVNYSILDTVSPSQSKLYSIFKSGEGIKGFIKNIFSLIHYKDIKKRFKKFISFQTQQLNLIENAELSPSHADCFISGSDQLWNVRASDFSDAYYLDFLPCNIRRISYAASFGPLKIDWTQYDASKYARLLKNYQHISVRGPDLSALPL